MIVLVAKCALKQTKQRRHIDTGLINYRHPQKMRFQLAYSNYLFRFFFFLEILHVQILFLVVTNFGENFAYFFLKLIFLDNQR